MVEEVRRLCGREEGGLGVRQNRGRCWELGVSWKSWRKGVGRLGTDVHSCNDTTVIVLSGKWKFGLVPIV